MHYQLVDVCIRNFSVDLLYPVIVGDNTGCDDEFLLFGDLFAVDHAFLDLFHVSKKELQFLRIDVLAVLGDDHVFDPSGHVYEAVFVDPSDVSGVEPASSILVCLDDFFGSLFILVITDHESVGGDDELALALFVGVLNADDAVHDGLSCRAHSGVILRCYRRDRAGLGESVSLKEDDSQVCKPLAYLGIDGSGCGNDVFQASADTVIDLFENFLLDIDSDAFKSIGGLHHVENGLFLFALLDGAHDRRVNMLDQERHGDYDGRSGFFEVVRYVSESLAYRDR